MRWLVAIAVVVLLVLAYFYYDEFGLPTKVEEFLENLISDEEEEATPTPILQPRMEAPTATPILRDSDPTTTPARTPRPTAATAAPTPTPRLGTPTATPITVPIPVTPTPTPEPTADPNIEVRCSQADDRGDIGNEDQYYTTLEECLQYGNWYTPRGLAQWKSTEPTPTPTPLQIRPEKSELGLNLDGKAVWTFVVNGQTVYCNIGELRVDCANRLGLSGVY